MLVDCTNTPGDPQMAQREAGQEPFKARGGREGPRARYVGVRFHGECRTNPWEARCRSFGKKHNLGYFATAEEAARAYDAFARNLGRRLNFSDEEPACDAAAPTPVRTPVLPPPKHGRPRPDELLTSQPRTAGNENGEITPTEATTVAKRPRFNVAPSGSAHRVGDAAEPRALQFSVGVPCQTLVRAPPARPVVALPRAGTAAVQVAPLSAWFTARCICPATREKHDLGYFHSREAASKAAARLVNDRERPYLVEIFEAEDVRIAAEMLTCLRTQVCLRGVREATTRDS